MKLHKTNKKEKPKAKTDKVLSSVEDIMPTVNFNEELGVGILKDGRIIDCLEIICSDMENDIDAEVNIKILTWEKLYDIYGDDLKIISSFFPVSTNCQIEYLKNVIDRTDNPLYRTLLQNRIEEFEWMHDNYVNKSFLLFFFSKNVMEYKDNYTRIYSVLNSYNTLVINIPNDIKKQQFFLLNNKNLNF